MLPSENIERKFEEIYNIDDYEILTDSGWQDVSFIGKTIKYQIWEIETENGLSLKCADDHIVFSNNKEIFVKDLQINQYIETISGPSRVIKISCYEEFDNMYDVQVPNGHKFYSNGILSHNSTIISICCVWFAIFNEHKYIGVASNKADSAKDILSRMKLIYEELPSWLKPGLVEWNKSSIEFENGTKIVSAAASPDAFRGRSINLLVLDEFAHLRSNKLAEEFWLSNYPALAASKTSKIIIISTPKGIGNLFYEIYSGALRNKNEFIPYQAPWNCVPSRDEEWRKKELENIGPVRFAQEFDCEFTGSTTTVVKPEKIEYLIKTSEYPKVTAYNGFLKIYEEPIENAIYIAGTDVCKGTGGDSSVVQVARLISINPIKLKHVATYENNTIDTHNFGVIVYQICKFFNNAYVLIENNAEGIAVINRMWWDFEYENMINEGSKIEKLGIRATTKTKTKAILLMKKFLEDDILELHDEKTIKQIASFVDEKGKMAGADGLHDDLVSALYWMCYVMAFDLFDESMQFNGEKTEDIGWGIIGGNEGLAEEDGIFQW